MRQLRLHLNVTFKKKGNNYRYLSTVLGHAAGMKDIFTVG